MQRSPWMAAEGAGFILGAVGTLILSYGVGGRRAGRCVDNARPLPLVAALRRAGVRLDCFGAAEGRSSAGLLRRCGGQVGNLPHWLRLCGGQVFRWTASALRRAGREPAPLLFLRRSC